MHRGREAGAATEERPGGRRRRPRPASWRPQSLLLGVAGLLPLGAGLLVADLQPCKGGAHHQQRQRQARREAACATSDQGREWRRACGSSGSSSSLCSRSLSCSEDSMSHSEDSGTASGGSSRSSRSNRSTNSGIRRGSRNGRNLGQSNSSSSGSSSGRNRRSSRMSSSRSSSGVRTSNGGNFATLQEQQGCPHVLKIEEKVMYLTKELGLTEEEVQGILQVPGLRKVVRVTSLSKMRSVVAVLTEEMEGATPREVGLALPRLLGPSIEGTIKPRLARMKEHGIRPDFRMHQTKFRHNFRSEDFDQWLLQALRQQQQQQLRAAGGGEGGALPEDSLLEEKKQWFMRDLGLTEEEWSGLFNSGRRAKAIQEVSLDKMRSVAALLREEMSEATPRALGLALPRLIKSSIERTIKPRLARIRDMGISRPQFRTYARAVCSGDFTDKEFEAWVAEGPRLTGAESMEEKRVWCTKALGLREEEWEGFMSDKNTAKRLRGTSLAKMKALVEALGDGMEGATPREVGRMLPHLVYAVIGNTVKRRLEWMREMGVEPSFHTHARRLCLNGNDEAFKTWVLRGAPARRNQSRQDTAALAEKKAWFTVELGLSESEWANLFLSATWTTKLRSASLERMQHLHATLVEGMAVDGVAPREVGLQLPSLLGPSVDNVVKPRLARLRELTGARPDFRAHARAVCKASSALIKDEAFEAWLAKGAPAVERGWEGIDAKRRFFVDELGLTELEWAAFFQEPEVVDRLQGVPLSRMRAMADVLLYEMDFATPEEVGLELPAMLGTSVETTVKPRLARMREMGIDPVFQEHVYRLRGRYSNKCFEAWLLRGTPAQRMREKRLWFMEELGLLQDDWLDFFELPSWEKKMRSTSIGKMKVLAELLLREMKGATPLAVGLELPRLLGVSVGRTVIPRLARLREEGITPNFELHAVSVCSCCLNEVAFERWLAQVVLAEKEGEDRP